MSFIPIIRIMAKILKIGPKEFEKIVQGKISSFVAKKITAAKLAYSPLNPEERDDLILKIVEILADDSIPFSGAHRKKQWQKGWNETLHEYKKKPEDELLVPKHFYKYTVGRIRGDFVKLSSKNFELNISDAIIYWVIEKYLRGARDVFDFGCGTGHNLLKIREINKTANITGLDWVSSSQKTVQLIAKNTNDKKNVCKKV